jgi:two-component system KDP operon response regulator KdpE
MKEKILVIDDDTEFLELMRVWLQNAAFDVFIAADGIQGLKNLYTIRPNLVLLDANMPEIDGWEVCQRIRYMCDIPVLMITVNGQKADLLRGFDLGADDYLVKPVHFKEVVARVRAILRRVNLSEGDYLPESFHNGEIEVNWKNHQVRIRGQQVKLTPTEFKLLSCLIKNRNWVVTHDQILEKIWGYDYICDKSFVKLYVRYLRKKIEKDPENPRYILTERGIGYRFSVS